jgi:hypothetical protein
MTIDIQKPELEALIRERMLSGGFQNVEDALIQALLSSTVSSSGNGASAENSAERTGADLITALQASPYREIELEPARDRPPVRDLAF